MLALHHIRHWRFMKGVLNLIPVGLESPGSKKSMPEAEIPKMLSTLLFSFSCNPHMTGYVWWEPKLLMKSPFSGLWFILRVHQWGSWV
jgi:hypothetical protein